MRQATNFEINRMKQKTYALKHVANKIIIGHRRKSNFQLAERLRLEELADMLIRAYKNEQQQLIVMAHHLNRNYQKRYLTKEEIDNIEAFAERYEIILKHPKS